MPTAAELARAIGATVEGDGTATIGGIGLLETARPTDLAFIVSAALAPRALASKALVVIAPPGAVLPGKTVLRHRAPKAAFAKAVAALVPERRPPAGVHPTAVVAPDAVLGANVSVGPHVVVESDARVGDGTVLHAGVVMRHGARVGRAGVLHPHVVCYPGVTLGDRVTVHAGTVIGSDGFGYVQEGTDAQPPPGEDLKDWRRYLLVDGPHVKVPQLGTVTIGDDVDIGAGCAIDRGTLGATVIGMGTKLDNLVHIAHNCVVGEHCLLTAGVCLAGSVKLGHHVVVGGQSGLGEGSSLGEFSLLAAHSAVVPNKKGAPNQGWAGLPARPGDKGIKVLAAQGLVPGLVETVRALRERVAELEKRGGGPAKRAAK